MKRSEEEIDDDWTEWIEWGSSEGTSRASGAPGLRLRAAVVAQAGARQPRKPAPAVRVRRRGRSRWGGSRERVLVIDEDQGKSGALPGARAGFGGLVAAVARGEVGIVMSLEVSRLSRNDSDWHHLVYLCRWTGTLIADEHGVYDPSSSADRMVLGIRGQVSELERDSAVHRMVEARWSKGPPRRSVHDPAGGLRPRRARAARDVERRGSSGRRAPRVPQVRGSSVPAVRCTCGGASKACRFRASHVAEVASDRLGSGRLPDDPQHAAPPIYGGAFVFGRSETPARARSADAEAVAAARAAGMVDWPVLIKDHHPAYISSKRSSKTRRACAPTA
ncbi:MAG: recombinase family protein [Myxococcales bacterium]|nr:recombinase family protein [Myxococcales bacterium]